MEISLNTSKWYDRLWAALIFFTRLPFWRIYQPPKNAYQGVVEFWPLAGWLTAGVMAGVLYGASMVFNHEIAIVLAIISRLLLTGALHEDGLADFFDGFGGGGQDRQRILDIMKDSHIGTYGVLALIFYFALLFFALHSLAPVDAALAILAVDPYAKMVSAQVIQMMPYARTEETAKNGCRYRSCHTRSAAHRPLPLVDAGANRLEHTHLLALSDDVLPLSLHLASFARLHRRLLWCPLPAHRTDSLSRYYYELSIKHY